MLLAMLERFPYSVFLQNTQLTILLMSIMQHGAMMTAEAQLLHLEGLQLQASRCLTERKAEAHAAAELATALADESNIIELLVGQLTTQIQQVQAWIDSGQTTPCPSLRAPRLAGCWDDFLRSGSSPAGSPKAVIAPSNHDNMFDCVPNRHSASQRFIVLPQANLDTNQRSSSDVNTETPTLQANAHKVDSTHGCRADDLSYSLREQQGRQKDKRYTDSKQDDQVPPMAVLSSALSSNSCDQDHHDQQYQEHDTPHTDVQESNCDDFSSHDAAATDSTKPPLFCRTTLETRDSFTSLRASLPTIDSPHSDSTDCTPTLKTSHEAPKRPGIVPRLRLEACKPGGASSAPYSPGPATTRGLANQLQKVLIEAAQHKRRANDLEATCQKLREQLQAVQQQKQAADQSDNHSIKLPLHPLQKQTSSNSKSRYALEVCNSLDIMDSNDQACSTPFRDVLCC